MTLYWTAADNTTTIEVWHASSEELLVFAVAPEQALDAFHHPFAHLAHPADAARSLELEATR